MPSSWDLSFDGRNGRQRRYRADAQIYLFGFPILRRKGVGEGLAVVSSGTNGSTRLLEFTGWSIPGRAAGLNRFGFLREVSQAEGECNYFGLMTSSPEESAEQARKALHSNAAEMVYSAIQGRITPAGFLSVGTRFSAPAALTAGRKEELIDRARKALLAAPQKIGQAASRADCHRPFLHAIERLLARPDRREIEYVYSDRQYRLRIERASDPRATEQFRGLRLLPPGGEADRISGRIHGMNGGKASDFRLWVDSRAADPLPLRIEYQPRSFLRLVFEGEE